MGTRPLLLRKLTCVMRLLAGPYYVARNAIIYFLLLDLQITTENLHFYAAQSSEVSDARNRLRGRTPKPRETLRLVQ